MVIQFSVVRSSKYLVHVYFGLLGMESQSGAAGLWVSVGMPGES
jgi:hypothetical protein